MSESPIGPQLEELDRQIANTVTRVVRELQQKLGERIRESSEEVLRRMEEELETDIPRSFVASEQLAGLVEEMAPPAPAAATEELLAAVARVDAGTSQPEILKTLVEEARRFASRTAFFLVRVGEIRGWSSSGWSAAAAAPEELSFAVPDGGVWAELARGRGSVRLDGEACGELAGRMSAAAGSQGILVPFVLRGQLAGTLYADAVPDAEAPDLASLQLLTHAAAQALETLEFGASPALRASSDEDAPSFPLWPTAAAAPEAVEPEAVTAKPEAPPAVAEEIEPLPPEATAAESPTTEPVEPAAAEPLEPETAEAPAEEVIAAEPGLIEPPASAEPLAAEPAAAPEVEAGADFLETTPEAAPAAASIWEEDEPTVIGQEAVTAAPEPPPPEAPSVLGESIGQETVQLDISEIQEPPSAPATDLLSPPAGEAAEAAQPAFELEPEPSEAAGFELEPEPLPEPLPQPPIAEPPDALPAEVEPTPEVIPPDTLVQPPPDLAPPDLAPTEVAPPPDLAPTEVAPPPDTAPLDLTPPEPAADIGHPASFAPPAQPAPPPTAAAPPSPPPSEDGGSEVRPPEDLEGPGLAFAPKPTPAPEAGEIPAGEEALHEEARRLARLLVSEIKLYNEEVIEEGKMAGNIYSRLRDDIDRSRQMYSERIDPRIEEDYFYQELVQRLAGGDPKLLGM